MLCRQRRPLIALSKGAILNGVFIPLFLVIYLTMSSCGSNTTECEVKCLHYGLCEDVNGECKATKDEHCTENKACVEDGNCVAKDGKCVPTRKEHCSQSQICSEYGKCSFDNGICTPKSDADCMKGSIICKGAGHCHYDPQIQGCYAKDDDDCKQSTSCKKLNLCKAANGTCV